MKGTTGKCQISLDAATSDAALRTTSAGQKPRGQPLQLSLSRSLAGDGRDAITSPNLEIKIQEAHRAAQERRFLAGSDAPKPLLSTPSPAIQPILATPGLPAINPPAGSQTRERPLLATSPPSTAAIDETALQNRLQQIFAEAQNRARVQQTPVADAAKRPLASAAGATTTTTTAARAASATTACSSGGDSGGSESDTTEAEMEVANGEEDDIYDELKDVLANCKQALRESVSPFEPTILSTPSPAMTTRQLLLTTQPPTAQMPARPTFTDALLELPPALAAAAAGATVTASAQPR